MEIHTPQRRQRGFTMIEILVAMVIFAIGLLAAAALQSKLQTAEVESYQRAQAAVLVQDMVNRMLANIDNAATYVSTNHLGTGAATSYPTYGCNAANYPAIKDQDYCDWHNKLLGRTEYSDNFSWRDTLLNARGCIEQVQAGDNTNGICQPAVFRVSVAWQGLVETKAPAAALACGFGQYGDETYRRVLSTTVTMGWPRCTGA